MLKISEWTDSEKLSFENLTALYYTFTLPYKKSIRKSKNIHEDGQKGGNKPTTSCLEKSILSRN